MKDDRQIADLLNKYYSGESTLDEERLLREYFSGGKIPDQFHADADLFRFFRDRSRVQRPQFEQSLDRFIQSRNTEIPSPTGKPDDHVIRKTLRLPHANRLYWLGGVAAAILLLVGILIELQLKPLEYGVVQNDTYEDPYRAYQEAKKIMYYVSETMNAGTAPVKKLEKLDKGVNYLHPMFSFGSGVGHLEHLSTIQKTKQLIEKQ